MLVPHRRVARAAVPPEWGAVGLIPNGWRGASTLQWVVGVRLGGPPWAANPTDDMYVRMHIGMFVCLYTYLHLRMYVVCSYACLCFCMSVSLVCSWREAAKMGASAGTENRPPMPKR